MKATYNIDENRVTLAGISDGGSGVYFHAARTTTPYAAFLPYIGHVAVVSNPRMQADGEVFARNFTNKPFYIVNTENDRLYPYHTVAPYVEEWRAAGADITFRPIDGAGTRPDLDAGRSLRRIEDFLVGYSARPATGCRWSGRRRPPIDTTGLIGWRSWSSVPSPVRPDFPEDQRACRTVNASGRIRC